MNNFSTMEGPPEERDPTPEELMCECVHAAACRRACAGKPADDTQLAGMLGCDECDCYDDALGPMALQISVSDGTTGHAVCSRCRSAVDPWDRYGRHCGARITNRWRPEDET